MGNPSLVAETDFLNRFRALEQQKMLFSNIEKDGLPIAQISERKKIHVQLRTVLLTLIVVEK